MRTLTVELLFPLAAAAAATRAELKHPAASPRRRPTEPHAARAVVMTRSEAFLSPLPDGTVGPECNPRQKANRTRSDGERSVVAPEG